MFTPQILTTSNGTKVHARKRAWDSQHDWAREVARLNGCKTYTWSISEHAVEGPSTGRLTIGNRVGGGMSVSGWIEFRS